MSLINTYLYIVHTLQEATRYIDKKQKLKLIVGSKMLVQDTKDNKQKPHTTPREVDKTNIERGPYC